MTAYRRPEYTRQVLEALTRCDGIGDWVLLPSVDPGNHEVLTQFYKWSACDNRPSVNPQRLGLNRNTHAALERAYDLGAEIIVHLEDDTVPSPDALLYFEWAIRELLMRDARTPDGRELLTAGGFHRSTDQPRPGELHQTIFRPIFVPWGWAVDHQRLAAILKHWSFLRDKIFSRGIKQHFGKRYADVAPLISRIKNIGRDQGENAQPRIWQQRHGPVIAAGQTERRPFLPPAGTVFPGNVWQTIKGWFDFSDVYDEALDRVGQPATFVEVGCWRGRSAAYLAERIKHRGLPVTFFAVDTWRGTEAWKNSAKPADKLKEAELMALGGNMFPVFWDNIDRAGIRELVRPLQMPSLEAAKQFADESLDFVFIDADHTYEAVAADICAWLPKIKPGGTLAGHDYGRPAFPGVARAVRQLLPDHEVRNWSWIYHKPLQSLLIVGHPRGFTTPTWEFACRGLRHGLLPAGVLKGEVLNRDCNRAVVWPHFSTGEDAYRDHASVLDALRVGRVLKDCVQPWSVIRYTTENPGGFRVLYVDRDAAEVRACQVRQGWGVPPDPPFADPADVGPRLSAIAGAVVNYDHLLRDAGVLWKALTQLGYEVLPFDYRTREFLAKQAQVSRRLSQLFT